MRVNGDTVITGQRVVLVPYRREHVPLYHGWMQSPELQVWSCGARRGVICYVHASQARREHVPLYHAWMQSPELQVWFISSTCFQMRMHALQVRLWVACMLYHAWMQCPELQVWST